MRMQGLGCNADVRLACVVSVMLKFVGVMNRFGCEDVGGCQVKNLLRVAEGVVLERCLMCRAL